MQIFKSRCPNSTFKGEVVMLNRTYLALLTVASFVMLSLNAVEG